MRKETDNCDNKNDRKTSEKLKQQSRRKVLTGIAASGAIVSATWHKPIINAVVLPAHAQTSADVDMGSDTDDQQTTIIDFFATTADASEVGGLGKLFLDQLIPSANARVATNEEPLTDLKFEAEALDQSDGEYKIRIAAEKIENQNGRVSPTTSRNFIFGWEGTITNLNSAGALTGTGCAQNETAEITALSSTSLTLEMSYFSKTIELVLDAGAASLPTFPLSCS